MTLIDSEEGNWSMTTAQAKMIAEYDAAAEWCAKRGIKGNDGDPLPPLLSKNAMAEINYDPDAFQGRIRDTAYALAMGKHSNDVN
jgi:hypothetical protein